MRPINATAAMVVSNGTHFNSSKKIQELESDIPHETKKIPFGVEDLTETRFGRFTVKGLFAFKKGRWVVRCVCGIYSIRKAKAIKNPLNNIDRCGKCMEQLFIKRRFHYEKTGIDLPLDNFDN